MKKFNLQPLAWMLHQQVNQVQTYQGPVFITQSCFWKINGTFVTGKTKGWVQTKGAVIKGCINGENYRQVYNID